MKTLVNLDLFYGKVTYENMLIHVHKIFIVGFEDFGIKLVKTVVLMRCQVDSLTCDRTLIV